MQSAEGANWLAILVEKPGPDDAIRFIQIYETGSGDWTKDRKKSLRRTRIKLSGASWREGRTFPLRAEPDHERMTGGISRDMDYGGGRSGHPPAGSSAFANTGVPWANTNRTLLPITSSIPVG
ncbi:MAG: hypothetical protein Q8R70_01555 [Methanoregula sp.]|nr:hypothetical protein [Methanoregula sp.]